MLAQRPPMGWNSWNTFGEKISEKIVMESADALVDLGYAAAGYEYIVIDDCWSLRERDESGRLVADPEKFPHGMKYLSDYIHAKGLKFGMYSCAGVLTCAGYPSSYGHEFTDAETFAEWGVDFLKYDFCNFPDSADTKQAYKTMAMALRATGREILFSACNWGVEEPWKWMRSIGAHMYRSTGDIFDNYVSMKEIADSQSENLAFSGAYCFNDMDMLTVGMYGKGNVAGESVQTDAEYRSQFVRWCLCGVPLMLGGDIRSMNGFSRNLVQNRELIAIDQDIECRPPYRFNDVESPNFFRLLSDGRIILAFFNYNDKESRQSIVLHDIGLPVYGGKGLKVRDVLTGEELGIFRELVEVPVGVHDCRILEAKIVDLA